MEKAKEIIEFYAKELDKDMNSSRQEFANKIFSLSDEAENMTEERRQVHIMESMLYVFDKVAMRNQKRNYVSELFNNYDDDDITNWKLKTIMGEVQGHFPMVVKSCDTIMREGF